MLADDHEDEVEDPDNGESEDQTNDARNDFSLGETRNEAAYPRSYGDNCEDYADNVRESEIIAFCHTTFTSFLYCKHYNIILMKNQVLLCSVLNYFFIRRTKCDVRRL